MVQVRYLDSAKRDLKSIASYISRESGSVETARRVLWTIRERCRKVANLQGTLGRPRAELGQDIRSLVSGSYVVLFRYRGSTLEVVNVIEGHRDIDAVFGITDTD